MTSLHRSVEHMRCALELDTMPWRGQTSRASPHRRPADLRAPVRSAAFPCFGARTRATPAVLSAAPHERHEGGSHGGPGCRPARGFPNAPRNAGTNTAPSRGPAQNERRDPTWSASMKRFVAVSRLARTVVLGACFNHAAVSQAVDPPKAGRDNPLGTAGSSPELRCTPTNVAFGDSVSCALANVGPQKNPAWRYQAENGITVSGPTGVGEWAGAMVIGGEIVVDYHDPRTESSVQLVQRITVQRRMFSWAPSVSSASESPRLDHRQACASPPAVGTCDGDD